MSSPADPSFYALTAAQKTLLLNRGVSLAQQNAGLNYVSSLTGEVARRADAMVHLTRVDWHPKRRLDMVAEYSGSRWSSPAGLVDAPVVARGRGSLGSSRGSVDQGQVTLVLLLGKGFVSETVLRVGRDLQYEAAQAPLAQETAGGVPGTSPAVEIGPQGLLFGTPPTVGTGAYPDERQFRAGETLTWRRDGNVLLLGATADFLHDEAGVLRNAAGTFRYDSGRSTTSAGGLVDFLTDYTYNASSAINGACPSATSAVHLSCFDSFAQAFGSPAVMFSTARFAGFADDTWRARPGLTLHLGLRYDYTLLPLPQFPSAAVDALFGQQGATSVFPEDRDNFGPRASFAWEPLGPGRGTLRVGYGLFYGRLPGATVAAALTDTVRTGATSRIRITPATLTNCPQSAGQSFGYPCSFVAAPEGTVAQTSSALVFGRGFRLPAIQQASVTLERSFRRATTVSVGYVGNLDRQLPTSTDLNIIPATRVATYQLQGGTGAAGVRDGETFSLPLYTSRVSPSFGPVTAIRSSANGTYHALEVRAATRPMRSVEVRGTYTWSKSIDYAPNLSATPRTDAQLDPFANGYDKGLSSLHYPWAATLAGSWAPERRGLLGGWRVAANWTERAGRPYSYDLFGGTRLPGGHRSLNGSGGALYLPTVGRNTLRLPARGRVDAVLSRAFAVGRGVRLRGEVEGFNLLNSQQVTSVVQRAFLVGTPVAGVTPLVFQDAATIAAEGLSGRAFGTPNASGSSAGRERQLELGMRVEF